MTEKNVIQGDDFDALLSATSEDISSDPTTGGGGDPDFFRPSLKAKGIKDGVYKTHGRFVPNLTNKQMTTISKWVYLLKDPASDDGKFYVDCTSNDSTVLRKNIITNAYFAMKDSSTKIVQDIAKRWFQRKRAHWSLFYIISDVQDETLNGKVKIFRYGNQVYDKIQAKDKEDLSINKQKINVFDAFQMPGRQGGRDLQLLIKEVTSDGGGKMPSYIESEFMESSTANFSFDGKVRLEPTQENKKMVVEFLRTNSPDMTKVLFQPWDNEFENKIIESVKHTIGDMGIFNAVYYKTYGKRQHQGGDFSMNAPSQANQGGASAPPASLSGTSVADLASKVTDMGNNAAPVQGNAPVSEAGNAAPVQNNTPVSTPSGVVADDINTSHVPDDIHNVDDFDFDDLGEN